MEKHDKKPHRQGNKRRNYNEDYFAEILTEEQAYWLGFLFGDGALTPSKNTVGLALASGDRSHLCKLAVAVGDKPSSICIYQPAASNWQVQPSVRILFGRKRFYQHLVKLGFTNKKAGYSDFPPIPKHLFPHFIRGWFDADGYASMSLSAGKYKTIARYRFSISVANEQLATRLCAYLREKSGEHLGINRDHSIWAVRATNFNALRALHDLLYKDANVYLERKKTKFDAAINYPTRPTAQVDSAA